MSRAAELGEGIEMLPVSSSNIAAVGYSAARGVLRVRFNSGAEWVYPAVPPELYEDLAAAESVGRFFSRLVKPRFEGFRVTGLASPDGVVPSEAPLEGQTAAAPLPVASPSPGKAS